MAATKGETKFESRNPKLCQKRGQTLSGHTGFPESSACPPKGQTPFLTEPKQIQNRKFECPKQTAKHAPLARHPRIPDKTVGRPRFEHLVFDIWICFGFRASDFEFQTCAYRARVLRLKTLTGWLVERNNLTQARSLRYRKQSVFIPCIVGQTCIR
jgi:hypothetical protein